MFESRRYRRKPVLSNAISVIRIDGFGEFGEFGEFYVCPISLKKLLLE